MHWIKKMDPPFSMVSTSSVTVQSLGKIAQCALAVGAKMWCLFFVLFLFLWLHSESGAPCVRGVHSSNKHCIAVYCLISMRFLACFFTMDCFLQTHYLVLIFVVRWCHNFREIAVKNCEKSKNLRLNLCAPLRIDS